MNPLEINYNVVQDITVVEACPLFCQNNSTCLPGNAQYQGHPHRVNSAELALSSLQSFSVDGYYCRCSKQYTAVDCSVPFEFCAAYNDTNYRYASTLSPSSVACYHGGTCHTTLLELANDVSSRGLILPCDCSTAKIVESNGAVHYYGGLYCESFLTEDDYCGTAAGDTTVSSPVRWYCLNGGICQSGSSKVTGSCSCPEGYVGPHCEVYLSPSSCDLPCRNGGTCQLGGITSSTSASVFDSFLVPPSLTQHCTCPDGFAGLLCEYQINRCSTNAMCLHGSTCQSVERKSGPMASPANGLASENQDFVCVYNNTNMNVLSNAFTYCSPSEGVLEFVTSMAVPAFCVNHGVCQENLVEGSVNKVFSSCQCPESFFGPHCEFIKNAWDWMENYPANYNTTVTPRTSHRAQFIRSGMTSLTLFLVTALIIGLWTRQKLHCNRVVARLRPSRQRIITEDADYVGRRSNWTLSNDPLNNSDSSLGSNTNPPLSAWEQRRLDMRNQNLHMTNLHDLGEESPEPLSLHGALQFPAFLSFTNQHEKVN